MGSGKQWAEVKYEGEVVSHGYVWEVWRTGRWWLSWLHGGVIEERHKREW